MDPCGVLTNRENLLIQLWQNVSCASSKRQRELETRVRVRRLPLFFWRSSAGEIDRGRCSPRQPPVTPTSSTGTRVT
jgi:hypothetical protein